MVNKTVYIKMAQADMRKWAKQNGMRLSQAYSRSEIWSYADQIYTAFNTSIPDGVDVFEAEKLVFVKRGSAAEDRLRFLGLPDEGRFGLDPYCNIQRLPAICQIQEFPHQPKDGWRIIKIVCVGKEQPREQTREIVLNAIRFGWAG